MGKRSRAALLLALLLAPAPASAWGDDGHRVIGLLAETLLTPSVRRQVEALLATDEDPLSGHDIVEASTWADHLRDSNADGARSRTRQWHFADVEVSHPSLDLACFGRARLPPGILASAGPAHACLVDKIDQFAAELAALGTPPDERLLALKFLLHFVGDLHQPLHVSDDEDRGGNEKRVTGVGAHGRTLHHFWDTEIVHRLGPDPVDAARSIAATITPADRRRWSAGTPDAWALDTFDVGRRVAYGLLPPPGETGSYRLGPTYLAAARESARTQLAKAAVRLTALLERAFAGRPAPPQRNAPRP